MMSTWCSKHVETYNKFIIKKNLCIKLIKYWDAARSAKRQNPLFLFLRLRAHQIQKSITIFIVDDTFTTHRESDTKF